MNVCGLKLTHDSSIAIIQDGSLVFNCELEKRQNNLRHIHLYDLNLVTEILEEEGYPLNRIDYFAVDGWESPQGTLPIRVSGNLTEISIAPYTDDGDPDPIRRTSFEHLPIPGLRRVPYSSYCHTTTHVLSAYLASPFAADHQDAFVLVWDGGIRPRLYQVTHADTKIVFLGSLPGLAGNALPAFASQFEPFLTDDPASRAYELSVPGKIMAYTALGEVNHSLLRYFHSFSSPSGEDIREWPIQLAKKIRNASPFSKENPADILATWQVFVGMSLEMVVSQVITKSGYRTRNLCLTGGCALNIVWNSLFRESPTYDEVWIPPFPNDSGSAIGAACAEMVSQGLHHALSWEIYTGPRLVRNQPASGWTKRLCTVRELAQILYHENEPVVTLSSRAELGPRALGHRSILAPADHSSNKDRLNQIKEREWYRPVAPVCRLERLNEIFEPNSPDPFMLFTHRVRQSWKFKIPAAIHLDGTARVQSVESTTNPLLHQLLTEYEALSGIPVLCNTSANLKGRGFFPDVYTPTAWGRTRYVWVDGELYSKPDREACPSR